MSQGELPDFDLDNSYTIPPTGEPHNLDDTVDYSDDEESFQEAKLLWQMKLEMTIVIGLLGHKKILVQ